MAELSHPPKTAAFYIKRIIGFVLLLAMAAVFFFSAYTKMASQTAFDSFQWTFLDLGINSTFFAGILARLFIGFELMLGLFLLFHIYLKQFTYPVVITLLGIFIIYLLMVIVNQGDNGNCGCFGNTVTMKPSAAIWKNVAMICTTLLLMYIYPIKPYKNQEWICTVIGMLGLVTPFLIAPVFINDDAQVVSQPIDLNPLYANNPPPAVELRKGKHIIAFMSLTCQHCRKAAYLLQIIHHQHPDVPIFIVLAGSQHFEDEFFKETHAIALPHILFTDTKTFSIMSGSGVPAIYWINNSVIERKANYYQLDPKSIKEWLKK